MKNALILVLVGTFILTGCKKYPEGPAFSLRSKTERVTNIWKYATVTYNGNDQTQFFDNYTIEYKENFTYTISTPNSTHSGSWEFVEDKEKIQHTPPAGDPEIFTILKLKEKEMILERVSSSGDRTVFTLVPRT